MERNGKVCELDELGVKPNLWVQRDGGHIDLGLEYISIYEMFSDGACIDLSVNEARAVAQWLLDAADEAERYTADE